MQKATSTSVLDSAEKKEKTCYPLSMISLSSHATQDATGV